MTLPLFGDLAGTALLAALPVVVVALVIGLVGFHVGARAPAASDRDQLRFNVAAIVIALVVGFVFVKRQASVFDDAFISFRYANNWLRGDGLVFNSGERVEGITNLLWTVGVAVGTWLTGVELPLVALVGDVLAYVGCVVATAWLSRWNALQRGGAWGFALAPCLVALQYRMTASATTGLETGPVALTVVAAAVGLAVGSGRGRVIAGGLLLAGTLMHPDLALAWVAGVVATAACVPSDRRVRSVVEFAATLPLFAAATAWRVAYYGDLLPNTYYAKSANVPYYAQGIAYAGSFFVGSHLWVALGLAAMGAFLVVRRRDWTILHLFFGLFLLAKSAYVIRLGGDFMDGRLFVDLLPPLLLLAEDAARRAPVHLQAWLLAALLATVRGTCLLPPGQIVGFLADENSFYPLVSLSPVTVQHGCSREGVLLHQIFVERGLQPVITSGGIGQLAYYSDLPLIDIHGLTDAVVAHGPTPSRRGHPGHEKWPSRSYLEERQVRFARSERLCSGPHAAQMRVRFRGVKSGTWCLFVYDRALMADIAARAPEVAFVDFPAWLDRYIVDLPQKDPETVAADWVWFQEYYFNANDDPFRRAAFTRFLEAQP